MATGIGLATRPCTVLDLQRALCYTVLDLYRLGLATRPCMVLDLQRAPVRSWTCNAPLYGLGLATRPCTVLDLQRAPARSWTCNAPLYGLGSATRPCTVLDLYGLGLATHRCTVLDLQRAPVLSWTCNSPLYGLGLAMHLCTVLDLQRARVRSWTCNSPLYGLGLATRAAVLICIVNLNDVRRNISDGDDERVDSDDGETERVDLPASADLGAVVQPQLDGEPPVAAGHLQAAGRAAAQRVAPVVDEPVVGVEHVQLNGQRLGHVVVDGVRRRTRLLRRCTATTGPSRTQPGPNSTR